MEISNRVTQYNNFTLNEIKQLDKIKVSDQLILLLKNENREVLIKTLEIIHFLLLYSFVNYSGKPTSYNGQLFGIERIVNTINEKLYNLQQQKLTELTTEDLLKFVSNSSKFFKATLTKNFKKFLQPINKYNLINFKFDIPMKNYLQKCLGYSFDDDLPKDITLELFKWINATPNNEIPNHIQSNGRFSNQKECRIEAANIIFGCYVNKRSFLNLGFLFLTSLPDGVINKFNWIEELDLSVNQISNVPAHLFKNLKNLKSLELAQNQIINIEEGSFDDLIKLERLYLRNNALTNIPQGINKLINLKDLSFSVNNISSIGEHDLAGLYKLKHLNLSYNDINNIHPNAFYRLYNLTSLSLHENKLTELPTNIFNGLQSLEDLLLHHNKITTIHPGAFNNLRQLNVFSLNKNRITISVADIPSIFLGLTDGNTRRRIVLANNGFNRNVKNEIISFFNAYPNCDIIFEEVNLIDKLDTIEEFPLHRSINEKLIRLKNIFNNNSTIRFNIDGSMIFLSYTDPIELIDINKLKDEEILEDKYVFLKDSGNIYNIYFLKRLREWIVVATGEAKNPMSKRPILLNDLIGGEELDNMLDLWLDKIENV
ncbi:MAG TPA: leucine-rich repeat protein [Burkholderiales bacterium]|nr:leucine-rich repeat protein [Burkholderiales bacterium]